VPSDTSTATKRLQEFGYDTWSALRESQKTQHLGMDCAVQITTLLPVKTSETAVRRMVAMVIVKISAAQANASLVHARPRPKSATMASAIGRLLV
jgi:hypothetical protein